MRAIEIATLVDVTYQLVGHRTSKLHEMGLVQKTSREGVNRSTIIDKARQRYPNREQAVRIQQALESLYKGVQGEYYYADAAWAYVKQRTGVDLLGILQNLASERTVQHGQ